ncbi:MAG: peptidylprolyl isomerase [Desulfuromonadia bacterium]
MKSFHRLPLVLTCSLILAAGCSKKEEVKVSSTPATGGPVVAEVNGSPITVEEFKKEIDNLPPYLKPMTETFDGRKEMLETMVIREMILQEAAKEKIDESPKVKEKLADLRKRLIVEEYLRRKVEEKASLSDDDIKKFYEENKDKFKHGEQIRASHILLKDEKNVAEVQDALKKGVSFEEVAKKYSTDGAAPKGGDLGWFGKGSMLPEFEKAAFALKEGEISQPVKTKFGTHIIKLTGKRGAGSLPLDEVKEQIKQALLPQKQKEVFEKVKEELKKSAKYSIREDVLKGMETSAAKGSGK